MGSFGYTGTSYVVTSYKIMWGLSQILSVSQSVWLSHAGVCKCALHVWHICIGQFFCSVETPFSEYPAKECMYFGERETAMSEKEFFYNSQVLYHSLPGGN